MEGQDEGLLIRIGSQRETFLLNGVFRLLVGREILIIAPLRTTLLRSRVVTAKGIRREPPFIDLLSWGLWNMEPHIAL
jgi:hypothetical protein